MKSLFAGVILLSTMICLFSYPAVAGEQWNPMTEELPPYSFEKEGEVYGICADVLLQILAENSIALERGSIRMLPWARAYKTAQDKPGSILLTTTRTPEREEMFKWVGPVVELNIGLLALKKNGIKLNTAAEAGKYRIGTSRGGVAEQLLLKQGVRGDSFDPIGDPKLNIKKLAAGRIDLFAFSIPTAKYLMLQLGMNPDDYESVYTLKRAKLNFAFHRDTDEVLIRALNATLAELREVDADGKSGVDRIIESYLNP